MGEKYDYYDTTFFCFVCYISILLHAALAFIHWDYNHWRSRETESVEQAVLHWKPYFPFEIFLLVCKIHIFSNV
jgi:hypothetical protein